MTMPSRARNRLLTGLLITVCVLVAAVGIRISQPADFQLVRGSLNEAVSVREGEVTIDDVRFGSSVLRSGDTSYRTAGMFVVVHVTAEAPGQASLSLQRSQLTSGDRVYLPYSSLSGVKADPGFRSQVDLIFEVDPSRIDDLAIELWPGEIITGYYQRIRVPLEVTSVNAAEARAAGRGPVVDPEIYSSSSAMP